MSVHLLSEREAAGVEENYTPIGTVYVEVVCCGNFNVMIISSDIATGCPVVFQKVPSLFIPEPVDIRAEAKYCTKTSGKMIRC